MCVKGQLANCPYKTTLAPPKANCDANIHFDKIIRSYKAHVAIGAAFRA